VQISKKYLSNNFQFFLDAVRVLPAKTTAATIAEQRAQVKL
jgi:hypothetical protein